MVVIIKIVVATEVIWWRRWSIAEEHGGVTGSAAAIRRDSVYGRRCVY